MPDCEELEKAMNKAERESNFADRAYHIAESNLNCAQMAHNAAEAGEAGSLLSIETGLGFIVLEGIALYADYAARKAIDAATDALNLAFDEAMDSYKDYKEARKEYCDCMEKQ